MEGYSKRWFLSINITNYDELIEFYKSKGGHLDDRQNAVNDPSYLEASLSNGQIPRDKFVRIHSKIDLNGYVTRRDYTKAINELIMNKRFDDCKLLFIYIGGHGVEGDQILFSDGHTIHYTDVIAKIRRRLRMINKAIILLNNLCRPPSSRKMKNELPLHEQFVLRKQHQNDPIQTDAPVERYICFNDRGDEPHHILAHTGSLFENA